VQSVAAAPDPPPDPFGSTTAERALRRLAGAGVTVVLAVAVFGWWFPLAAAIAVVGILAVGVPVSWVLERRRPSRAVGAPLLRYAVVGGTSATVVLFVLGSVTGDLWLWVVALYGLPVAVVSGLVASAAAYHLPARLLVSATSVGLVVGLGVLPTLWWWQERPPAPYDYLVVNDTPELRASHGDALGLAAAVAVEFDRVGAASGDRRRQETWITVSERITSRAMGDHEAWARFTEDEDLPVERSNGATVRLVSVIVRDGGRACVVVAADGVEVRPGTCSR
jgi:hypothetical protein